MALALLIVGLVLAILGGIGVLIEAFKESILWGLGSLLIPVIGLVFVFLHWKETRNPFLLCVAGNVLLVVARGISSS